MIPEENPLSKAQPVFDQAIAAGSANIFFFKLYEFMRECDTNPSLEKIGQLINENQAAEVAHICVVV